MKKRNVIAMLFAILLSVGCVGIRMDRGEELINHSDFETVVIASPSFVELALEIIAELEHRLESQ